MLEELSYFQRTVLSITAKVLFGMGARLLKIGT
jgi:hypothetical protein